MSDAHPDTSGQSLPSPSGSLGTERLCSEVSQLHTRVEQTERELAELRAASQAQREILDIDGAAAFLGVHRRTVERLIKGKRVPHARLHGQRGVRFIRTDLMTWLRRGCPRQGTTRLNSRRRASPRACGACGTDSKEKNPAESRAAPAEER